MSREEKTDRQTDSWAWLPGVLCRAYGWKAEMILGCSRGKEGCQSWSQSYLSLLLLPGTQHWAQSMGGPLYSWGVDQPNIRRNSWKPCWGRGGLSTRLIRSKC